VKFTPMLRFAFDDTADLQDNHMMEKMEMMEE